MSFVGLSLGEMTSGRTAQGRAPRGSLGEQLGAPERHLELQKRRPFGVPRLRRGRALPRLRSAESLCAVSAPGGVTIGLTRGRFAALAVAALVVRGGVVVRPRLSGVGVASL